MEFEGDVVNGRGTTTQLYETMLGDKKRIENIIKSLKSMKPLRFDFRIVDIGEYKNNEPGVKFFQTVRERDINELHLYEIEFGEDVLVNGCLKRKIYNKKGTQAEMLQWFEDICVKRLHPDINDWEEVAKQHLGEYDSYKKEKEKAKRLVSQYLRSESQSEYAKKAYQKAVSYLCEHKSAFGFLSLHVSNLYASKQYQEIMDWFENGYSWDPWLMDCVGDIEYYGKLQKPNFKKAYQYYKHGAKIGNLRCAFKIAKMYKDGIYLKKNVEKYMRIIKRIYDLFLREKGEFYLPAIDYIVLEMSYIEQIKGNYEKSLEYCLQAKENDAMVARGVGGVTETFEKIIKQLYTLIECDETNLDIYDLLYLLQIPRKIFIMIDKTGYRIQSLWKNDKIVVEFNGEYYKSVFHFFETAKIGDEWLYSLEEKVDFMAVFE